MTDLEKLEESQNYVKPEISNTSSPTKDSEVPQIISLHPQMVNMSCNFDDFDIDSLAGHEMDSQEDIEPDHGQPEDIEMYKLSDEQEDDDFSDDPSLDLYHHNEEFGKETTILIPVEQVRFYNQELAAKAPQSYSPQNSAASCTNKLEETLQEPKTKIRKKPGRKKEYTGLTKRKDVIIKRILRKVKGFYWKGFNKFTKYNSRKRSFDAEDFFYSCVRVYLTHELKFLSPSVPMMKTLGDMMLIKAVGGKEDNEFYDTLYRYSYLKFTRLVRNKYFRFFVKLYSNKVDPLQMDSDDRIGLEMILKDC
ncbi:unnamed protein product [Moneuplotes crassus]|uniref:Uncharacterized protein n=1 Tax=Euplotes crassus TaxID=5936 RepID=A0AAD1XWW7_EUPCR|nr:unnamed protein product [Moneuplotes crassus]